MSPCKLASVLLQYPTRALFDGIGQLGEAVSGTGRASHGPFGQFLEWLSRTSPDTVTLHYASAWLIWAVWPFSRLVHAWSAPLWYLWRPYIVYRRRAATYPAEPGTSGRRWRKVGVPY